ncbi:MAG: hypothetical protein MJ183_04485 [Treponemataceae bacterium]|nr:hypothetical protein [Treponemataceae bacterium]
MVALILGLVFIAFTVFACLPQFLDWSRDIIAFLKGFAPVLSAFIGIVSIFIGIADIKDKKEARKEEEASLEQEAKAKQAE